MGDAVGGVPAILPPVASDGVGAWVESLSGFYLPAGIKDVAAYVVVLLMPPFVAVEMRVGGVNSRAVLVPSKRMPAIL